MSDFFHSIVSIDAPFNMIVLIVLFGSLSTAVATFITQIRKYASHRQELEFNRDRWSGAWGPRRWSEFCRLAAPAAVVIDHRGQPPRRRPV